MSDGETLRRVPWRIDADGVRLFIHLTPKASKDEVGEIVDLGAGPRGGVVLKVRVRAIPDKGKANKAVIKLLAKWLGLPKSSLELLSGSRSRQKCIKIIGDGARIVEKLDLKIK